MLEAMTQIQTVVTRASTFDKFESDRESQMIVERGFEIVSEASKHLTNEAKQRHPDIEWKSVRDIGNLLRHEYQRISQYTLWETARVDVPRLMEVCRTELDRERTREPETSLAKSVAGKLLEAGREHARTKPQEPTPEPKIDPTRSIRPDYSKGMELRRKKPTDEDEG